jgi:hypothetical protein
MKKEAIPKRKWLKRKNSNEKRGNPKTQGAQKKDLQWKRGNPKTQGAQKKNLQWEKKAISQTENQEPLAHRSELC